MDEKKLVTWEAFKKYHEHLVEYIEDGDGVLNDLLASEGDAEEEEGENHADV